MSHSSALLRYGGESIPYELVPSPRRKTLGIEVHPDLRVVVRVPPGHTEESVGVRVLRRAQWINRQLEIFRRFSPRTPPRHYVSGETHLYLGRQYRLKLVRGAKEAVTLRHGFMHVSLVSDSTPGRVAMLLGQWYRARAQVVFDNVLNGLQDSFVRQGHLRPKMTVRAMTRRWGSFSRAGRMTLNVNLVCAPKACIEYVVLHELCHLVHRHHGVAFYRLLSKLMPDWDKRKLRLEQVML